MLLSMTEMLKKARAGKYAIPQPDFVNIQMAAMYLEAANNLPHPLFSDMERSI